MMELPEFKKQIDSNLLGLLNSKIESLPIDGNSHLEEIFGQLKAISAGGKRIRPYLAYLAYKTSEGKDDMEAIKLFTFIEVFHLFCLIHDDVMDRAEKRHGIETIQSFVSKGEINHYGNSQAILAGDLLLSWALEGYTQNKYFKEQELNSVRKIFFQMIDEVVVGQMIDLSFTKREKVSRDEIIQKIQLKTVGYSFVKPLLIGAALAGNLNSDVFIKLGSFLGTAFQIQDDLIDIEGIDSGKPLFNDISEAQHTLFTNFVFENGTSEQKRILHSLFGKNLKDEEKKKLRGIFEESGAIKFGRQEIDSNIKRAEDLLKSEKIDREYEELFLKFIQSMSKRNN